MKEEVISKNLEERGSLSSDGEAEEQEVSLDIFGD
jgi:hypothetical protein